MKTTLRLLLFSLTFLFAVQTPAQQTPTPAPTRDPVALSVLQKSIAAMGASVPADSVTTGSVVIVAGSDSDKGTIRILTRTLDQSREEIQTGDTAQATIYSKGSAALKNGPTTDSSPLDAAVTSQSACFPLPLLAGIANDPDIALIYVGLETVDRSTFHHIRTFRTFASNPRLKLVAEFSARDIWIDSATGLPSRLSYVRRDSAGPSPGIPMELTYSDYRDVGGALFPFLIRVSLNGTPWATVTINNVVLNTSLSDADFAVQ